MTSEVYMSGIYQMGELGDKLGVRTKWSGCEWDPATFILPVAPKHAQDAFNATAKGYKIAREQFPEAEAVWNEKAFSKAHDFLWLSGFLAVKEKIAKVLRGFDLGGGELVPVPLYKADLVTPWEEPFYYINYGGPKDTFLPEESRNVHLRYEKPDTGERFFKVVAAQDGDIALSAQATEGADVWVEKYLFSKLFLSGALIDALIAAKIDVDIDLLACRIVEG